MRSPFPVLLLISLIVFGLAVGVWLLRGGDSTPLLSAAPETTQVLLHAPDMPRLWRALSGSALNPGGPAERLETVRSLLLASGAPALGSDSTMERLATLLAGEAALLLVPAPRDAESGGLIPAILARIEPGGRESPLGRLMTPALAERGARWQFHVHYGMSYASLEVPEQPPSLWVGEERGIVAITTTQATMRDLLSTLHGEAPSLLRVPAFRRVRGRLGTDLDLMTYVTGDWLRSRIASMGAAGEGPSGSRTANLLGLRSVRGVGAAVRVQGDLFVERLFLALSAEHRGLPGELLQSEPTEIRSARALPAGFPFYAGLSFSSIEAAYERMPDLLAGAADADTREMRDRIVGLEKFLALDPRRDVLSALGTELTVGFGGPSPFPRGAPNRALLNAHAAISVAISNRSAVRRILERFDGLARAAGAIRSTGVDPAEITFYEFNILAPLAPSYRLTRRHLIVGTSPDLLRSPAGGFEAALADSHQAQRLRRILPRKAHVFFSGETARLIDWLWLDDEGDVAPLGPWERRLSQAQRLADLPPTIATGRMGESGFLIECVSPVSPSLLALIATRDRSGSGAAAPRSVSE